jgi:hypothetical protein
VDPQALAQNQRRMAQATAEQLVIKKNTHKATNNPARYQIHHKSP